MTSPFVLPPHPLAQNAAKEVIAKMHAYMDMHPESELHRVGKMFGVLVCQETCLAAFSAQLDGSYEHEGFVPPVYAMETPPIGKSKQESQRLQKLLFAQYNLINGKGESKNLLDIFASEKPIVPAEIWFSNSKSNTQKIRDIIPPSGAGECCAPKLLQYALMQGLHPVALAEFWVGASPKTEIRKEGTFYAPCSGRCRPILKHMLQGIEMDQEPQLQHAQKLCTDIHLLYEDDYIIVIDKPSGLLSVPGKTDELSASSYLSKQRQNAYVQAVHRLDQDTSGLLVLAKTPETYKILQSYFQRRDVFKRYEAVCVSSETPSDRPKEGLISLPLLPNPYDRPRQMVNPTHGKTAVTRYMICEKRPDGTIRVDLFPLTGRTHQLRVHAAHPEGLNAPIVGDRIYGQNCTENNRLNQRLLLHAAEIVFPHPDTQKTMHFCVSSRF